MAESAPQQNRPPGVLVAPALINAPAYTPPKYTVAQATWLSTLSRCEDPTGSTTIRILDVNNRYSYGKFMFQMQTWLWAGKLYGYPTKPSNIRDPDLQRAVAAAILADGGWRNWLICGGRTIQKLGFYPKG